MRHLTIFIIILCGYLSACSPSAETTSQTPTAENTSEAITPDANASEELTSGIDTLTDDLDTANNSASDSIDATLDSAKIHAGETRVESDVLGASTRITMDQLPKAVRDAYLKMSTGGNTSALQISQVKTAKYPLLYKIESTTGDIDNVHYFTPDGQEVPMPKIDQ